MECFLQMVTNPFLHSCVFPMFLVIKCNLTCVVFYSLLIRLTSHCCVLSQGRQKGGAPTSALFIVARKRLGRLAETLKIFLPSFSFVRQCRGKLASQLGFGFYYLFDLEATHVPSPILSPLYSNVYFCCLLLSPWCKYIVCLQNIST